MSAVQDEEGMPRLDGDATGGKRTRRTRGRSWRSITSFPDLLHAQPCFACFAAEGGAGWQLGSDGRMVCVSLEQVSIHSFSGD